MIIFVFSEELSVCPLTNLSVKLQNFSNCFAYLSLLLGNFSYFGNPSCFEMCEIRIECRCLSAFDFVLFCIFKELFNLRHFNSRISTFFDQDF